MANGTKDAGSNVEKRGDHAMPVGHRASVAGRENNGWKMDVMEGLVEQNITLVSIQLKQLNQ